MDIAQRIIEIIASRLHTMTGVMPAVGLGHLMVCHCRDSLLVKVDDGKIQLEHMSQLSINSYHRSILWSHSLFDPNIEAALFELYDIVVVGFLGMKHAEHG